MVFTLPLPDWVPTWVHAVILCAAGLFALLFLVLPFTVFGIRGRLELIEARLDEIQGEIRSLSLRLPEPLGESAHDNDPYVPSRYSGRPPIPPAPRDLAGPARVPLATVPAPPNRRPAVRPDRTEPRLY